MQAPAQNIDDEILDRRHRHVVVGVDEEEEEAAEEPPEEDDNGLSTSSTLPATTMYLTANTPLPESLTTMPSISSLTTLGSPLTSSAIYETTSVSQAAVPVQTSTLRTITTSSVTAAVEQPSQQPESHHHDNDCSGGRGPTRVPGISNTDTKVAIAFGVLGMPYEPSFLLNRIYS